MPDDDQGAAAERMFSDLDTIGRPVRDPGDRSWALQMAAQRLRDEGKDAVAAVRMAGDDGWRIEVTP